MTETNRTFTKITDDGDNKSSTWSVSEAALPVGGQEGAKKSLLVKPSKGLEEAKRLLFLISKKYHKNQLGDIKSVIAAYKMLRRSGFNVPSVTRFSVDRGQNELILSDLTGGGRYLIWGYNDKSTNYEAEQLKKMSLKDQDFNSIEQQIRTISTQAASYGFRFYSYYFHLRKDIQSGRFEVFLLDVNLERITNHKLDYQNLLAENNDEGEIFMSKLKSTARR